MSKLIERNYSFLRDLSESTISKRREIIESATEDNINALTELSINLLQGNLAISEEDKIKLSKHKTFIRNLSQKEIPISQKKKGILYNCNILPMIISPLLGALGSVFGKCIVSECL